MVGGLLGRARIPQSREISHGKNRTSRELQERRTSLAFSALTLATTSFKLKRHDQCAGGNGLSIPGLRMTWTYVSCRRSRVPSTTLRATFRLRSASPHYAEDDRLSSASRSVDGQTIQPPPTTMSPS